MSSFLPESPPSSFSSSSSSESSFFLVAAAFFPVDTFDYFLEVFLGASLSSESSSEELAAFLATAFVGGACFPFVGNTLTSSSLESSSSDELAAFFGATFPLVGAWTFPFGLISSESSESSESSDSTFFLLTTATCLSLFLAYLSVPLLEVFDSTLALFPARSALPLPLACTLATGLASESDESPYITTLNQHN